jgi:N-terminal domain of anti-restriction factor ArdC
MLWSEAIEKGYASPIRMTFKQALDLEVGVRKGEHGSLVVYADKIVRTETDVATGEDTPARTAAVALKPASVGSSKPAATQRSAGNSGPNGPQPVRGGPAGPHADSARNRNQGGVEGVLTLRDGCCCRYQFSGSHRT